MPNADSGVATTQSTNPGASSGCPFDASDSSRKPTITKDCRVVPNGKSESESKAIINAKNHAGKEITRDGVTIRYDNDGFPIFNSKFDTYIPNELLGNSNEYSHFQAANKNLATKLNANPALAAEMGLTPEEVEFFSKDPPYGEPPPNWTWHHHQDTGKMQLVNLDEHEAHIPHTGGMSIWGGGYKRSKKTGTT